MYAPALDQGRGFEIGVYIGLPGDLLPIGCVCAYMICVCVCTIPAADGCLEVARPFPATCGTHHFPKMFGLKRAVVLLP